MTLLERRKRETRRFAGTLFLLLALIGGVAYGAWFAPWAKPMKDVPVARR